MSLDQTKYWKEVRQIEKSLTNPCFIVNLKNEANISENTPYHSSIFIASGSHRIATPEEIEKYLSSESQKRNATAEARKPIQPSVNNHISISPEMIKAMVAEVNQAAKDEDIWAEPKLTTSKKTK